MITRRKVFAAAAGLMAAPLAACEDPTRPQSAAPLASDASDAPPAPSSASPASAAPSATPAAATTTTPSSTVSSIAAVPASSAANDAAARTSSAWTREAFEEAMAASGRPTRISEAAFQAIQARKTAAIARIRNYLAERFGQADPRVISAFQQVPREYYHYLYPEHVSQAWQAYEEVPKPWAIGYGSVLSDYLGQAYMTQIAQPRPGDVSLEIGTGSGFQSSLLSRIVGRAHTIEIIQPIGNAVDRIFKPLGYDNVEGRVGDGYYGWPEVKDGFDIIMVTCVAQYAPPELFRQLKPGGRLIIPIGQPFRRGQVLYVYSKDENGKIRSRRDVGVFFIPMTGAMMDKPAPRT